MLGLIAGVYLLLAVRIRFVFEASLGMQGGSLMIRAGAAGLHMRYDAAIRRKEETFLLTLLPRYGEDPRQKKREKERQKPLRRTRRMLWLADSGRMELLRLHVRIGLGDAGETALASGALRALAGAAFLRYGGKAAQELHITPDFDTSCFAAHGCCIFSCQAGDIMLAVLKAAVRKSGKEGFRWKSTPLKA